MGLASEARVTHPLRRRYALGGHAYFFAATGCLVVVG